LRILIRHSIDAGLRKDDPTFGLRVKLRKSDGIPTWGKEDSARFKTAYPLGTKQGLALALLLNMAARRSDVVKLGRGNVRDGRLSYTQQKTGRHLVIPVLPETAEAINAAAPSDHMVFLLNDNGTAFTAEGFSKWFSNQCERIGLTGLSPHGLRKAACVRLAHAGCSAPEIAAVSGHRNLKEVQHYIEAAEQERLAENAMARLVEKGA
jgi:integrase